VRSKNRQDKGLYWARNWSLIGAIEKPVVPEEEKRVKGGNKVTSMPMRIRNERVLTAISEEQNPK